MTSDNPLISIILPAYCAEGTIGKCFDSLIAQTYRNIEILVVDDGSLDKTGVICDDYAERDARIRVFHRANHGVSASRNYALKRVSGDYVGFIDSDDWIEPNMYERLLTELKAKSADIAVCSYVKHKGDELDAHELKYDRLYTGRKALYEIILDRDLNSLSPTFLVKRDLFEGLGYPEGRRVFEDTLFLYKLVERSRLVVHIKDQLYHYIRHDSSAIGDWNLGVALAFVEAQQLRYEDLVVRHPEFKRVMLEVYYRKLKSAKRRYGKASVDEAKSQERFIKEKLRPFYIAHAGDLSSIAKRTVTLRISDYCFVNAPSIYRKLKRVR